MQEKLNRLLEKYSIERKAVLKGAGLCEIDGNTIPLLPWRNERRFTVLKELALGGTLIGISVFRVCRIEEKGRSVNSILYREFDLCEWITNSKITDIMTFKNENTANCVLKLENGIVCTVEAASTLAKGAQPIDKHELISQRGIACDRVVDTQIPQQSIYAYTDSPTPNTYTDVDFELFGLCAEEVSVIRQAFAAAKREELAKELLKSAKRLEKLIAISDKSASETANIKVGE